MHVITHDSKDPKLNTEHLAETLHVLLSKEALADLDDLQGIHLDDEITG